MSTTTDAFLLKEYDSALQLTYHIDELRAKLTSFYVTFSGIAGAGLIVLLKGEASNSTGFNPEAVVALLMGFVGILGVVTVGIVARLRRVQIEHFRIISNIRSHVLQANVDLWNVVVLSPRTLPNPNRKSGSYLWVLIIILLSAFFFTFSISIYTHLVLKLITASTAVWVSVALFTIFVCGIDRIYFVLAIPLSIRTYTKAEVADMHADYRDRDAHQ